MNAIEIRAKWAPQHGYNHERDIESQRGQSASEVWAYPKISLTTRDVPDIGPTDILIRVRACGMCGSDVAMISEDETGHVHYPFMMASPIIPGHEFAGEVEAIGSDVHKYRPSIAIGSPVTAECPVQCGYCHFCGLGEFASCAYGEERGFTIPGAMAEYCVVDVRQVWRLDRLAKRFSGNDLFVAGSLVEPHAGVFKAITDAGFKPGSDVLVTGAGPIGLSAISILRAIGAAEIIVAEPSPERQSLALALGASEVCDPLIHPLDEVVLAHTSDEGVTFIFEASGVVEKNWGAITRLIEHSPPNIRLVFFGQSKQDLPVNPQPFIQHYVRFSGSHGHSKVWPQVINMLAATSMNPLDMVTKKIHLSQTPEALGLLRTDKSEGKITITEFGDQED